MRRERAQRDDHLRLDRVDLAEQERLARRDFVRLRVAVLRRAALDHVGDVDVFARQADRLDDLRQQLTRTSDERLALHVFVARPAPRRRTSSPRSDCRRRRRSAGAQLVQLAAGAVADVGANLFEDDARVAGSGHVIGNVRDRISGRRTIGSTDGSTYDSIDVAPGESTAGAAAAAIAAARTRRAVQAGSRLMPAIPSSR